MELQEEQKERVNALDPKKHSRVVSVSSLPGHNSLWCQWKKKKKDEEEGETDKRRRWGDERSRVCLVLLSAWLLFSSLLSSLLSSPSVSFVKHNRESQSMNSLWSNFFQAQKQTRGKEWKHRLCSQCWMRKKERHRKREKNVFSLLDFSFFASLEVCLSFCGPHGMLSLQPFIYMSPFLSSLLLSVYKTTFSYFPNLMDHYRGGVGREWGRSSSERTRQNQSLLVHCFAGSRGDIQSSMDSIYLSIQSLIYTVLDILVSHLFLQKDLKR